MAESLTSSQWEAQLPPELQLELLSALAADALVGVAIFDSELRFVYVNGPLAEMNGHTIGEHLGRTLDEIVPALIGPYKETLSTVFKLRKPIPDIILEGETASAPGVWRAWRESWYPLSVKGNEGYTAVLVREITEERKLALQVAQANQRKDKLMATIAHELRNPLAPLLNAAALARTLYDPSANGLALLIERQVAQLVRLVEDLSEAAQARQGGFNLVLEPVRVGDVVEDALANVNNRLTDHGHALDVRLANRDRIVRGDRGRLVQVLSNVLGNAIKYTPRGGRIEIQGQSALGAETLEVRDNGPGIPPESLEDVFEPFFRAHPEEKDVEGFGIGLWLSKAIVDQHGGTLSAHSGAHGGTVIKIRLASSDARSS